MTYSTNAPSVSAPIGPKIVLLGCDNAPVDCYWCRKLLKFSDGQLTLQEIARKLYLPLKVCQRLARRALDRGWAEVVATAQPPLEARLAEALTALLGEAGQPLLEQANRMTRVQGQLPVGEYRNYLVALELAASKTQREQLRPVLAQMRHEFAL